MRHHQHGRIPGKNSVAVAVEMNDVGTNARCDLQQPIAGTINILPRIIHPFEPVRAFEQAHIFAPDDLLILLATETLAHAGESDLDSVRLKRTRKLERIRPYAADWIDGHQNFARQHARGLRSHKSHRWQ